MKEPGLIHVLIVAADTVPAPDLCSGLQKHGYAVVGIAGNAKTAERLFKENDVDLILTDIPSSGARNGIDIVAELMKIKQVPVVYLIAAADAGIISGVKQTYPV